MSARAAAAIILLFSPGAAFAAPSADPFLTPVFGSYAPPPHDALSPPERNAGSSPPSAEPEPLYVPASEREPAPSSRGEESGADAAFIRASAGLWLTSAMHRWQTSFQLFSDVPKADIAFGSTLEFNEPRELMRLYSAEFRPFRRFSLEVHYADNGRLSGHANDHDWLYGPNYIITVQPSGDVYTGPKYTDMSLSQSDLSGSSSYLSGNFFARVFIHDSADAGPWDFPEIIDAGLGYIVYDNRLRMTNTVQIISTGDIISTPPPGPIAGVDSTFHFHYEGATVNFREETGITRSLRAVGVFAWAPFVVYRGEGYWNLRTDLRSTPPNFVQTANGNFMEGRLALAWEPVRRVSLDAGYLLTYAWIRPGKIEAYNADGTTTSQGLDSAWSERKGWFCSAVLQF